MAALDTALEIAAGGTPVFPCGKDKRPAIDGGHGFHDATLDPGAIRELFARAPHAVLVGSPTGEKTGFDVLDIDPRHGGDTWEREQLDRMPETRIHQTPGGGRHYLFRHAPGVRNSSGHLRKDGSIGGIALGVDVRGDGGYVILPPCEGYRVVHDAEIAEWPDWLLDVMLREPDPPAPRLNGHHQPIQIESRRLGGFTRSVQERVRNAAEGSKHFVLRNAALSLGGIAAAAGLSDDEASNLLLQSLPGTVKDWKNAAKTIAWGLAHGRNRPIELEDRRPNGQDHSTHGHRLLDASEEAKQSPAEPPDNGATFPLEWFRDITTSSSTLDFVEGLLCSTSMIVIYGESGCGKTFWTTDLCLHIAAGWEWNGRAVDQGGVIYVALEGAHGIRNRVAAFKAEYGLDHDLPFAIITTSVNMLDPAADIEQLIRTVRQAATKMKVPVRLVVLDTLSRALAGGNENSPEDMGALVTNGARVQQETQAAVAWIHHSGKDTAKGARGHSLLRAATDTEIEVTDDDGARTSRVTKQREMECVGEFSFKLEQVILGQNARGKDITSCIVKPGDVDQTKKRRMRMTGHTQKAFSVLTNLLASQGKSGFPDTPSNTVSVPDEWWRERFYQDAMPGATQEAKQKAFRRSADALVDGKAVAMAGGRVWLPYGEEE